MTALLLDSLQHSARACYWRARHALAMARLWNEQRKGRARWAA